MGNYEFKSFRPKPKPFGRGWDPVLDATPQPPEPDPVTPRQCEELNILADRPMYFDPDNIERIPYVQPEEVVAQAQHEVLDIVDKESRCLPSEFQDSSPDVRYHKALMVNLYFEYGGNWRKVFKDRRAVGKRTMQRYWTDDIFRAKIEALDPLLVLEAKGVVVHLFNEAEDEKVQLAAALRFLEQADGQNWDRGIRRQVVANKGSLQNTILSKVITDEEYLEVFIKDKLNKLPPAYREALRAGIESVKSQQDTLANPNDRVVIDVPQAVPNQIRVSDLRELKDPFEDPTNLETENE